MPKKNKKSKTSGTDDHKNGTRAPEKETTESSVEPEPSDKPIFYKIDPTVAPCMEFSRWTMKSDHPKRGPQFPDEDKVVVKLSGLTSWAKTGEIVRHMKQYDSNITRSWITHIREVGIAFIVFTDKDTAQACLENTHQYLCKRVCKVRMALNQSIIKKRRVRRNRRAAQGQPAQEKSADAREVARIVSNLIVLESAGRAFEDGKSGDTQNTNADGVVSSSGSEQ